MMQLLLWVLLLQGSGPEELSETAIDSTYTLSLVRNLAPRDVTFRLSIEEKADRRRSWELATFNRMTKKYTFLRIPEVMDWSVSYLLVQGDAIWAGLVHHPEGADRSGGLIRHDVKSRTTQKFRVDDVIHRIDRLRDGIYLTTSNGIYVLKGDRLMRHRVEPDINGKLVIVSEQL